MKKIEEFKKKHEEINKDLLFNKQWHSYKYGTQKLKSVTTFVKEFFPEFNKEYHSKRVAERDGVSVAEVLSTWEKKRDESLERGNKVHELCDNFITGKVTESNNVWFGTIKKFFEDHKDLKLIGCEMKICYPEKGIAGTMDLLMCDEQENVYIFDWKTNESIDVNKEYQKGKKPIEHLFDNNYIHYSLQLNFYAYILKEKYGLEVNNLNLIHLTPDSYTLYEAVDCDTEVKAMLSHTTGGHEHEWQPIYCKGDFLEGKPFEVRVLMYCKCNKIKWEEVSFEGD